VSPEELLGTLSAGIREEHDEVCRCEQEAELFMRAAVEYAREAGVFLYRAKEFLGWMKRKGMDPPGFMDWVASETGLSHRTVGCPLATSQPRTCHLSMSTPKTRPGRMTRPAPNSTPGSVRRIPPGAGPPSRWRVESPAPVRERAGPGGPSGSGRAGPRSQPPDQADHVDGLDATRRNARAVVQTLRLRRVSQARGTASRRFTTRAAPCRRVTWAIAQPSRPGVCGQTSARAPLGVLLPLLGSLRVSLPAGWDSYPSPLASPSLLVVLWT
jgi:hypothetical protein